MIEGVIGIEVVKDDVAIVCFEFGDQGLFVVAGEVAEEVLGVAFVVNAKVAKAFLEFFGEAALLEDEEAGRIVCFGGWGEFVGAGGAAGGEFEEFGDRPIDGGGNLCDFAAEESHFSGVIEVLGGVEE